MDGSMKTMNSTWNGPPGQMVRALGKCFYPYTPIKMNDGSTKDIKDVEIGEILEDGSVVESVMKILNREKEKFYVVKDDNGKEIFVTGSHLVYDKAKDEFVKVKYYHKSKPTALSYDWFSCLITDSHHIRIGKEIFWDWEDHFIKTGRH